MEEGIKIKVTLESLPDNPMLETFNNGLENNIIRTVIWDTFPDCEYYVIRFHGNLAFQILKEDGVHLLPVRCHYNDRNIYFCSEDEDITYDDIYLSFIELASRSNFIIDYEIVCNAYDDTFFRTAEVIDNQYVYGKTYIDEVEYQPEDTEIHIERPKIEKVDQEEIKNIQTYLL